MKRYQDSDEMLSAVDYVVEANSFEQLTLWKDWNNRVEWEDCRGGFGVHVGDVGDLFPVWISLLVAKINGKVVLFWFPTSMVVDYEMCENYIKRHTVNRSYRNLVDAQNFHNVVHDTDKETQNV